MSGPVREIVLRQRAIAERVAHGHPWVWRDAIARGLTGAQPGDVVQVLAPDGSPIGQGLVDPASPLAVRMWTRGTAPLDRALWRHRASSAAALRAILFDDSVTDAYRHLHGEGDRMPGFVVDRYGPVAVAQTDGEAAAAHIADLVEAAWPELESRGVSMFVHRVGRKGQPTRVDRLRGPKAPDTVSVREWGVPFLVDLARGQKTGAFLDQRDNRRRVAELAAGRRVLNLFSYAGGFSQHAARSGAQHVTSVDIAAAAHATAQASFRAAGLDPRPHSFVTADALGFLEGARKRRETWDLVVSDPPSFAPNEKAVPRALVAYRRLHRACAAVLAKGGVLCAGSCSSHVDLLAFLSTLDDEALARDDLRVLEVRGAGPDHPTLPMFPEGRYLKFVVLG
jgi:23S rRNA (cytosine1962-C5)-methyltransferase